jgi:hypothetical protein
MSGMATIQTSGLNSNFGEHISDNALVENESSATYRASS